MCHMHLFHTQNYITLVDIQYCTNLKSLEIEAWLFIHSTHNIQKVWSEDKGDPLSAHTQEALGVAQDVAKINVEQIPFWMTTELKSVTEIISFWGAWVCICMFVFVYCSFYVLFLTLVCYHYIVIVTVTNAQHVCGHTVTSTWCDKFLHCLIVLEKNSKNIFWDFRTEMINILLKFNIKCKCSAWGKAWKLIIYNTTAHKANSLGKDDNFSITIPSPEENTFPWATQIKHYFWRLLLSHLESFE